MGEITVSANYNCNVSTVVDISPKTWEDVTEWHIKWDTLFVYFKGDDACHTFEMNSDGSLGIDWKRPNAADIYQETN